MNTEEKITIIEGPPPTFETVHEGWVQGLNESPSLADVFVTRLRTFNGPALVERCHRAWRNRQNIYLEYRGEDGLEREAQIVAARYIDTDEGHMLLLWLRLADDEVELEFGYEDDYDDDLDFDDDDIDYPDF